ncbi:MAG: hypothetical protein WCY92_12830 [Novosphingobium sp.]
MNAPQSLQGERQYGTTDERQVLALEMIADELVLICQQLERFNDRFDTTEKVFAAQEGSSLTSSEEVPPGITRTSIERFQVGTYHYLKLDDAKAELRRTSDAWQKG